LLGLGIVGWSHFVAAPSTDRLAAAMASCDTASEMRRGLPLILLELAGFSGIFTCMILMRFRL
jgi:hypothetical protein